MKIIKIIEDTSITHLIRAYGVSDIAKKVGVSTSLISQALRGKCCISEEIYLKIKEVLGLDRI